jgi:hypothetical protein
MKPEDLNENHRRYILNTVHHVDRLMAEAVRELSVIDDETLFEDHVPDATEEQKQFIRSASAEIRQQMLDLLKVWDIEPRWPETPGLWSAYTTLMFANLAIEEMKPHHLKGAGQLTPSSAAEITQAVAELQQKFKAMLKYLDDAIKHSPQGRQ